MSHNDVSQVDLRRFRFALWSAAGVLLLVMLVAYRPLSDWLYSQWLFDYSEAFVKRGLPGQLLRWVGLGQGFGTVFVVSAAVLGAALVALTHYFVMGYRVAVGESRVRLWSAVSGFRGTSPVHVGAILFLVASLTHSGTLQHLAGGQGRLEHLQLLLVVGLLVWMSGLLTRAQNGLPGLPGSAGSVGLSGLPGSAGSVGLSVVVGLVVSVVSLVSLLIHEAYFFFFLPIVFLSWMYLSPKGWMLHALHAGLAILLVGATWAISTYGLLPVEGYAAFIARVQSEFGDRADAASLVVVFRDFEMNVAYTQYWLFRKVVVVHVVFTACVLAPTVYLFWRMFRADLVTQWHLRGWLFLACFAPMGLTFLGFDVFRWISLSVLNAFVVTTFLVIVDPSFRARFLQVTDANRGVLVVIIVFSLLLGHLGDMYSFDWVTRVMRIVGLQT